MISTLHETGARRLGVGLGLLKCQPRRMIGQRNGNCGAILVEEIRLAGIGIEAEEIDGLFLSFRPMAFAADVGANRRKRIEAAAGDQSLDKDHEDEWPDQPDKTWARKRR